jgi:cytochrome c-type biogenesis protein CcmH
MNGPHRLLICVLLAAATLVLAAEPGLAVQPGEVLADKQLEARARRISTEIRCLVCQNQSIDDSDAPLAHDLRVLVRERIRAGESDAQVRDFIVGRYGTFVLLRPPVNQHTILLWFGPGLVLAGAAIALFLMRRRRASAGVQPLTPDEEARLAAVLGERGASEPKRGA